MDLSEIRRRFDEDVRAVSSADELAGVRTRYLGRKGIMAGLTGSIAGLAPGERGEFGRQVNELKKAFMAALDEKEAGLGGSVQEAAAPCGPDDLGLPGIVQTQGHLHLLTQVLQDICGIFGRMGFLVVEGPEIENEHNNFTGLNIPLEHPSRDAFDTFYLDEKKLLLRSHTSPVQVRVMQSRKPPLAVVVPGRVYRPDAVDASHSFMFHQVEGFLVDDGIRFSDLKGVLQSFAKSYFGPDIRMRFRPHFFPFTEPSAEMDISCMICKGKGCSSCGRKGWLEILGAGMIHPNVFKQVGYPAKKYTGFAFGMGVDRIAMLKYGINDIRILYENDMRFLRQF
ncbi:MAG: phenylalanine--tRNA ligase subunit alpha [Candidatus Omnitrophica bacterium]|nr:phenylalanine--tRNA ligase subunit alpha [Candidatus Omnitrophota bacterium]